jgi:DNA-3-methyladenine glycosylase
MDRGFFARPTPEVARALLGHEIVRDDPDPARLRIVETEAYLGPEDPGSHAKRGPDTQAGRLWEEPGQAYVYVCYGIHQMLNVVAHEPDRIGAVLVRAAEPVDGLGRMQERRGREAPTEIASGPGRLRPWASPAANTTASTSRAARCGSRRARRWQPSRSP